MMRFATILGAILMSFSAVAQMGQGTLKGKVSDFDNKDALPFASVVLFLNGNQVAGTNTDFDGEYTSSRSNLVRMTCCSALWATSPKR